MKWSDLTLTLKIGIPFLIILGLLMAVSSVKGWFASQNQMPVNTWIQMPEPTIVTKIKRVEVKSPPIIVTLEKQVAVEKLKLPDWIKNDIDKQVIADADIPSYNGVTNAAAILDTKTGVGSIIQKRMPLPFFAFENKVRIGGLFGFSTRDNELIGQAFVSWGFLRIGSIHPMLYGEAGKDVKSMVGAYWEN